jgi:hypothetical protein
MKRTLLLLVLLLIFSCDSKHKEIAIETTLKFETFENNGILKKGKLIDKNSVGFYKSGNQKFTVNLFNNSSDSLMFPDKVSLIKKTKEGIDFYYKNEQLILARKKQNDSIYVYNPDDLKTPSSIQVFDLDKNLVKKLDYTFSKETIYIHKKTDDNGNPTYIEVYVNYLPSEYEKKYNSEIEIQKLKLENSEKYIEQKEYVYY